MLAYGVEKDLCIEYYMTKNLMVIWHREQDYKQQGTSLHYNRCSTQQ